MQFSVKKTLRRILALSAAHVLAVRILWHPSAHAEDDDSTWKPFDKLPPALPNSTGEYQSHVDSMIAMSLIVSCFGCAGLIFELPVVSRLSAKTRQHNIEKQAKRNQPTC